MGEVIYVDFRGDWIHDEITEPSELCIEIQDAWSKETYIYYEDDMIPEPTETLSFKELERMNKEITEEFSKWERTIESESDFNKRF